MMDRDDIIRMAQEAGFAYFTPVEHMNQFKKFADLVAAAERERCAKVCENKFMDWLNPLDAAVDIRARD